MRFKPVVCSSDVVVVLLTAVVVVVVYRNLFRVQKMNEVILHYNYKTIIIKNKYKTSDPKDRRRKCNNLPPFFSKL